MLNAKYEASSLEVLLTKDCICIVWFERLAWILHSVPIGTLFRMTNVSVLVLLGRNCWRKSPGPVRT